MLPPWDSTQDEGQRMGSFSPVHWIIVLALLLIPLPPLIRILRRTGHSGWWSILYFLPIANWIGIWLFAYAKWPKVDAAEQPQTF
jgi:uncharacterized membrane protein YhaH (DUF805 family)